MDITKYCNILVYLTYMNSENSVSGSYYNFYSGMLYMCYKLCMVSSILLFDCMLLLYMFTEWALGTVILAKHLTKQSHGPCIINTHAHNPIYIHFHGCRLTPMNHTSEHSQLLFPQGSMHCPVSSKEVANQKYISRNTCNYNTLNKVNVVTKKVVATTQLRIYVLQLHGYMYSISQQAYMHACPCKIVAFSKFYTIIQLRMLYS